MATELIEVEPREPELKSEALSWPEKAMAIAIRDQESYTTAGSWLLNISALAKRITDHYAKPKKLAFDTHKAVVAAEKEMLDPLTQAQTILKRGIGAFEAEQERKRQEAERAAQEAARKIEEELRLRNAVAAEEMGADDAAIEEVLQTPVPIMAPVIAPTYQKVVGTHIQDRWHAEVTDIKALCKAVVDGTVPATCVDPNMPYLNSRATREKNLMKIPGVKAVMERR